jgi:hypothetical protein
MVRVSRSPRGGGKNYQFLVRKNRNKKLRGTCSPYPLQYNGLKYKLFDKIHLLLDKEGQGEVFPPKEFMKPSHLLQLNYL